MDYFYLSPFFEKNSINYTCAIQKLDFNTQKYKLTGYEYNLEWFSKDKEIYYISKSLRERDKLSILNYYYIFKGTIFQSPDLKLLMISNVESITNNLTNILDIINEENK